MQPTLCSRCKKNIATVFITRMEGDKTVNEGLCLKCAKSLGLPQVNEMMQRMGITDEDLDNLNNEMMQAMDSIENVEDLPGGEDDEEAGKTATFPFLNRLFNNGGEPAPKEETPAGFEHKEPARPDRTCLIQNDLSAGGVGRHPDHFRISFPPSKL